jgi:propanediol dehydratase small subunit
MNDYPVSEKCADRLRTPTGLSFREITLEGVLDGHVTMDDLRVTPEALMLQAEIAESAGRKQLGENLRRAAELARVPESFILEVYNALRPGRATRAQLLGLAGELERRYAARICAALVREAAETTVTTNLTDQTC